jgi:nucleoside-diphosphate-sugar epimerase
MRCLVTGATGHIGSHLVKRLLERNVDVAVLVRPTSNLWRIEDALCRLQVVRGDLANIHQSSAAIQEFAPEVVFHLGWYGVSGQHRNDVAQLSQNLYGSIELLRLAYECGCRRWIGLGSQAEYGAYDGILTEDSPTRPATLYGTVKLCVCLLSQKLCEVWKVDFVWLRLLASYGPMDDVEHMIPSVILRFLRSEKPDLTSGEQQWDYLYVEDVAEAVWRAAITPEAQGIFNLGSGEAYTIRSIVERIRDVIDPLLPIGFGDIPYRSDQIMYLQADITRLRQATGWSPRVRLDEGIQRTVEWFRENRQRYGQ